MPKDFYLPRTPSIKQQEEMVRELIENNGGTIYVAPGREIVADWDRFIFIPNVFIVGLPKKAPKQPKQPPEDFV